MKIIDLGLKFKAMTPGNIPRTLYLHHSAGINTVEAYHQMHLNLGWAGLGYNYVVDLDGKIYKGRPDNVVPAGVLGFNQDSLHICAIGNFDNMIMPDVQKESIKELICYLKSLYPTIKDIKGHGEVTSTACPGQNYPMQVMKDTFHIGLIQVAYFAPTNPIQNKVFKLQHILNAMGITDANGNRLVEDGWTGTHTNQALEKVAVRRGANNPLVGWLQEQLGIAVDNDYGNAPWHGTYDALINYQTNNSLYVDGVAGINTILKMVGGARIWINLKHLLKWKRL